MLAISIILFRSSRGRLCTSFSIRRIGVYSSLLEDIITADRGRTVTLAALLDCGRLEALVVVERDPVFSYMLCNFAILGVDEVRGRSFKYNW